MDTITIIGLIAATITTISLFPQMVRSWRTRKKTTTDNTFVTYSILFCIGIFLWLVYGIAKTDLPMMIANSISFLQGLVILVIQVRRLKRE
jgi:MtN3 and saliva related transmembrane protein